MNDGKMLTKLLFINLFKVFGIKKIGPSGIIVLCDKSLYTIVIRQGIGIGHQFQFQINWN